MSLSQGERAAPTTMANEMKVTAPSRWQSARHKLAVVAPLTALAWLISGVALAQSPTPPASAPAPTVAASAPAPTQTKQAPAAKPAPKPAAPAGVPAPVAPTAPATSASAAPITPPVTGAAPPPYPAAPELPPATAEQAKLEPAPEPPPPPPAPEPVAESPAEGGAIYEPPLPEPQLPGSASDPDADVDAGPLAPPPPKHVAPRSSLWVGPRPGVLVPLGSMWLDGEPIDDMCCIETVRPFTEFAGPGPSLGLDVGVRFGRHYQGFAFWERTWLGSGALENQFGGQKSASTQMIGAGFRFSTHPDAIGMLVEIAIGYRTFEAKWQSGTRLTASDDLFSTRLGFGVEWRVQKRTTVEALIMVGGGAFTDVKWQFADGTTRDALTSYDRYGQYIPFGLQVAAHWDVIASKD